MGNRLIPALTTQMPVNAGKSIGYQTLRAAAGAILALAALVSCGGEGSPEGGSGAVDLPVAGSSDAALPTRTELDPALASVAQMIEQGRIVPARLRLQAHFLDHPEDGQAHFLFGLTFHRERRYDAARRHFERALELDPGYHPLHHFYGWCLYYLGEPLAARRSFETHLEMEPGEGDSHFGIGLIDLEDDRLDDAEARFRRAIELQRDNPRRIDGVAKAHARLGETLARQGRPEEARGHLERGTELDPDQYEAFFQLYRVLLTLGEDEEAERALQAHQEARRRVRPEPSSPEERSPNEP